MAGGSLNSFGTVIGLPNPSSTTQDCLLNGVSVTSNGYNFEQGGVDATSCGLHGTGDVQNGADPNLGALGANGGPTNTQVPQTGSPLINVIPIPACGGPPPAISPRISAVSRARSRRDARSAQWRSWHHRHRS
jgi:hypothetical protein